MHGIAGDIALGLILAVLAAFVLAMAWAGIGITVLEPPPPRHRPASREPDEPGLPRLPVPAEDEAGAARLTALGR